MTVPVHAAALCLPLPEHMKKLRALANMSTRLTQAQQPRYRPTEPLLPHDACTGPHFGTSRHCLSVALLLHTVPGLSLNRRRIMPKAQEATSKADQNQSRSENQTLSTCNRHLLPSRAASTEPQRKYSRSVFHGITSDVPWMTPMKFARN